ncbi:MAG: F0F1 ATP synthase subunit epsilon [Bacilli bacterium]
MDKFRLRVVTPDKTYLDEDIEVLTATTSNVGQVSILAHHLEMVANLDIAPLIVKANGHISYYSLGGGVMSVRQDINTVIIVSDYIESLDEIDLDRAISSKNEAEKMLGQVKTAREATEMERKIRRAINRINLKSNYTNQ